MRLEVVRRGGIIGLPLRGVLDTSKLSEPDASQIEADVNGLRFEAAATPPPHPDSFEYEIKVVDDAGQRAAVLQEAQLPESLRAALDAAVAQGEDH